MKSAREQIDLRQVADGEPGFFPRLPPRPANFGNNQALIWINLGSEAVNGGSAPAGHCESSGSELRRNGQSRFGQFVVSPGRAKTVARL